MIGARRCGAGSLAERLSSSEHPCHPVAPKVLWAWGQKTFCRRLRTLSPQQGAFRGYGARALSPLESICVGTEGFGTCCAGCEAATSSLRLPPSHPRQRGGAREGRARFLGTGPRWTLSRAPCQASHPNPDPLAEAKTCGANQPNLQCRRYHKLSGARKMVAASSADVFVPRWSLSLALMACDGGDAHVGWGRLWPRRR